jgi:hypothetical protein
MPARRPKAPKLTPEEEKVFREHAALEIVEVAQKLAGHIKSGALKSCSVLWSVDKGLDINVSAPKGKNLNEVVHVNHFAGTVTLLDAPKPTTPAEPQGAPA